MAALLATSACGGGGAVPSNALGAGNAASGLTPGFGQAAPQAVDTTSILKKLTKDVVIGSTVDPSNGDKGPRAISIVPAPFAPLKKGQLVVCNFDDKSGKAAAGTTIELLDPTPGSKPVRFAQSSDITGCDGDAVNASDSVFGSGLTSHVVAVFNHKGKLAKKYSGSPFDVPFADAAQTAIPMYGADYVFVTDVRTGSLIDFSSNYQGHPDPVQVATGFAVNQKQPAGKLGPSGLQYTKAGDSIYVVDGVTNTVVAFNNVANLLEKDEIIVERGGKTFKCKAKHFTCGHLVHAGAPLDGPMASALLPNGNLIVANTQGKANTLVELTPTGKILDTKVVDASKTQGVYGLVAAGTDDSNTVLFFTDTNSNDVHELEQ
jgi:hypothetical protein